MKKYTFSSEKKYREFIRKLGDSSYFVTASKPMVYPIILMVKVSL